jgi:hypothetical protein
MCVRACIIPYSSMIGTDRSCNGAPFSSPMAAHQCNHDDFLAGRPAEDEIRRTSKEVDYRSSHVV